MKTIPKFKVMFYGPGGSGKTTLACQAGLIEALSPVLYIRIDADELTEKTFPNITASPYIRSVEAFRKAAVKLATEQHKYKTVIVDDISSLYDLAFEENQKKTRSGELDLRRTCGAANDACANALRILKRCDVNQIWVARVKKIYEGDGDDKTLVEIRPGITPGLSDRINYLIDCEFPLVVDPKTDKRYLLTARKFPYVSKYRVSQWLRQFNGAIENPNLGLLYSAFSEFFSNLNLTNTEELAGDSEPEGNEDAAAQ